MGPTADLLSLLIQYGYVALFLIVLLSAVYSPVPSSVALLVAGALSHTAGEHFSIFIAAAVGIAANIAGDIASYYIARHFSSEKRQEAFKKTHPTFRHAERYLKKYPLLTVIVSRFAGFLSPVVTTLSGFTKLRADIFIFGDVIGDIGYVAIWLGAGYLIDQASDQSVHLVGGIVAVALVVLVSSIAIWLFFRNPKHAS